MCFVYRRLEMCIERYEQIKGKKKTFFDDTFKAELTNVKFQDLECIKLA